METTPNTRIHTRIPDDLAAALDAYTHPEDGPTIARGTAITHLLRVGLAAVTGTVPRSTRAKGAVRHRRTPRRKAS